MSTFHIDVIATKGKRSFGVSVADHKTARDLRTTMCSLGYIIEMHEIQIDTGPQALAAFAEFFEDQRLSNE